LDNARASVVLPVLPAPQIGISILITCPCKSKVEVFSFFKGN
jgi:hypothetical protein